LTLQSYQPKSSKKDLENIQTTHKTNPPLQAYPSHIRQLQKTIGNRAVAQLMKSRTQVSQPAQGTDLAFQRMEMSEEELLQQKPIQKKENHTGMPDHLKSGLENLSGMDMSDVKVHYNSDKPAQMQALAYAQGNDIHISPGQEQHLPHEGWHVVQQRQGRVQETMRANGNPINEDEGLEREADQMGLKALELTENPQTLQLQKSPNNQQVLQLRKLTNGEVNTYSELLQDIMDEIVEVEMDGDESDLYQEVSHIFEAVSTDMQDSAFNQMVAELTQGYPVGTYPVLAQLAGVGALTHASGLADGNGILAQTITSVRKAMYPSSFNQAALDARNDYRDDNTNDYGNTWICSACDEDVDWNDISIDHTTPVAQHWNQLGSNQTRADRNQWYNDTDNHQCMCQSCNSSFGSGGVYYNRVVGGNFRN
jgi:hypothetical protein